MVTCDSTDVSCRCHQPMELPLLISRGGTPESSVVTFVNRSFEYVCGPTAPGVSLLSALQPAQLQSLVRRAFQGEEIDAESFRWGGRHFRCSVATMYEHGELAGSVITLADQSQTQRRAAIHAITRLALEASDLEAVAPEILQIMGVELGWTGGNLWSVDADQDRLVRVGQWRTDWMEESVLQRAEGLPGRVWDTARPEWVADLSLGGDFPRLLEAREMGIKGACGFPVMVESEVVGVFELFDSERLELDSGLRETLLTIATQVGQLVLRRRAQCALEAAYRREREIAKRFQSSLWPQRSLDLDDYQAAFFYRPALAEADVGGDFFNLFELGDGRLGLVIGDVGGKGLQAAVTAAWFQHALTALSLREGVTPASVLNEVQRLFTPLELECIVTVFFAILERTTGRLVYASGGHEPGLIRRCTGEFEWLACGQPPLIGFITEPYRDHTLIVQPQDLLLLYTDGLPEAGRREAMLGEQALPGLLAECDQLQPEEILRHLCRAAQRHAAGLLHDDIAMLALLRLSDKQSQSASVVMHRCHGCE